MISQNPELHREIARRRTFAIISHPDAGKTTITEKLLLFGGAIHLAGAVKAKRNQKSATSDWMSIERERGISVSTAVMTFEYRGLQLNLLDTPGHNDFSEDTFRTLTAVDAVLMVIDATKGVETQTKKLLEVCRLKRTPVITFMNKLDLEAMDPLDLLDNLEKELHMACTPMTWPIGGGKEFQGVYELRDKTVNFSLEAERGHKNERVVLDSLVSPEAKELIGKHYDQVTGEIELLEGASEAYDATRFLRGQQTPVFFGSALHNFGVKELLDCFCDLAPGPQPRETVHRVVDAEEDAFSGFVFKIQANMDRNHRDRMAFIRIVSGIFRRGMDIYQPRTGKTMAVRNAMTFLARDRSIVEEAYPGDIIGVPNHGTIRIADTFTQGENLQFTGVPSFAPELFRRVRLRDPMKQKQLQKGLTEVCEEGAAQLFRPLIGSEWIVGAVGSLQFDVIAARLREEYNVDATFEGLALQVCRWVQCKDAAVQAKLEDSATRDLYQDGHGNLCLLTETRFRADYIVEKNPGVTLHTTMELHGAS
ncbi:MAG: peptide chain release factor 3 [Deltaproteobacteria bacterium]|nr:peptide chain release factor 3 [Deltaproteobacteria bacterium]